MNTTNSKLKIGVVLPSRGLVFSRTMETVIDNLKGYDFTLYMAHDLPIPDCFNYPLARALKDNIDLIWFVEEDMTIPSKTLDEMIALFTAGHQVVSSEYADRRTGRNLVCRNEKGTVIYTGMGCLLVDAKVFEKLEKPYLRRATFEKVDTKDGFDYKLVDSSNNEWYGTQDVYFSYTLRKLGIKIQIVKAKIGHLQLVERGKNETNAGAHEIKEIFIIDPKPLEPYEFIGGSKLMNEKMVIPKFSGSCMGQSFTEGKQILLSPEVINTVGQDSFIFVKSKK